MGGQGVQIVDDAGAAPGQLVVHVAGLELVGHVIAAV